MITVYVELVPADTVKYELDKESGLLRVDRPQRYSNVSPEPYGFVPRSLCGPRVAKLAARATRRRLLLGDHDPLDVCVLTGHNLGHGGVLVEARPVGGLRLLDGREVDDKILAVLERDPTYAHCRELEDCPEALVDRIEHYFLTYKDMPGAVTKRIELVGRYGAEEAREVIAASIADYAESHRG